MTFRPTPFSAPCLAILACSAACGNIIDDVALDTPIGTVIEVDWSTSEPATGTLEWGLDESYGSTWDTPTTPSMGQHHAIVGLPPRTDVYWRVTARVDGDDAGTETGIIETPLAPTDIPGFKLQIANPDRMDPGYLLLASLGAPDASVIISTEGYHVWWQTVAGSSTEAMLGRDRRSLIRDAFSPLPESPEEMEKDLAEIETLGLDGLGSRSIHVTGQHHDFVELPDGTFGWIGYDLREVEGDWILGDRLMETRPDGTESLIWSTWDTYTYDPDFRYDGTGWTHANALSYSEADDTYFLTIRNLNTIIKLSRSGEVLWQLGGAASDFTVISSRPLVHMHRTSWTDDATSFLVFDNGDDDARQSRVVEFAVDYDAMTATEIWSYDPTDPPIWTDALGDVERLASGNVLIGWGSAGLLQQVAPDGEVVWQLKATSGQGNGYGQFLADLDGLW